MVDSWPFMGRQGQHLDLLRGLVAASLTAQEIATIGILVEKAKEYKFLHVKRGHHSAGISKDPHR